MRVEKTKFVTLFFLSFLAFVLFSNSATAVIQFSANATNITEPVSYKYQGEWQFNITATLTDGIDFVYLEHNATGTAANTTNITTHVAGAYYTTIQDIPGGLLQYRWFANDSSNVHNVSQTFNVTFSKSDISLQLWLNDSQANRWYVNGTAANITALINVSDVNVNISSNATGWVHQQGLGNKKNETIIREAYPTAMNVTAFFDANRNYTAASQTYYMQLTHLLIKSYSVNDTYASFNESVRVMATINNSFTLGEFIIEVNTSGGQANVTLTQASAQAGVGINYTYNLTKTNLGDIQANVTTIYINKIYANDTASNSTTNSTGLSFAYGRMLLYFTITPDPVGITESTVEFAVQYNTSVNDEIIHLNCTVTLFGTPHTTAYSNGWLRTGFDPSTAPTGIGDYTYNITCTNSSHQRVTTQSTLSVYGGTPDGGGGGAATTTVPTTTTQPGVPVGAYCGDGICQSWLGEDFIKCWTDCGISWPIIPSQGEVATTTTVPSTTTPVTIDLTPEQQQWVWAGVLLIIVGLILAKFFRWI